MTEPDVVRDSNATVLLDYSQLEETPTRKHTVRKLSTQMLSANSKFTTPDVQPAYTPVQKREPLIKV
jgi:hypothetical protein